MMNIALRAKAMLLDPAAEWPQIEQEADDPAYLLSRYVASLGLIPVLSGFVGACLIGATMPGLGGVRASLIDGFFGAIFGYLATFAIVLLLGLIIDLLAPLYGGRRNFDSAFKLAVYSYTPLWLAGIFLLLPGLRFLVLTGCYGVYLLALGLPRMMKSSEQKSATFVTVIVACAFVLTYAAAAAQRALFGTPGL
jgi:hypothetical protein